MARETKNSASRRQFLKTAGSATLIAGAAPGIVSSRAKAQQKTLKILRWKHFVSGYDQWFNEIFVKEWGQKNDTRVVVDNVGLGEVTGLATAEANAQRGHDLVLFLAPPPTFEDFVIDHREIYQECERRYGRPFEFAIRSSYNPKTNKHYGFCDGYAPCVVSYRKDHWDAVGVAPDNWESILSGGRRIKFLRGAPVGISLAPEHNSNYTLRTIMYAFGASVQDVDGNPALKSGATLEALKYGKSLYEEAMVADVLNWSAPSNNRFMLSGDGSLTVDTLSIVRAAENTGLPVNDKLWLANVPEGPAGRIGTTFSLYTYIIWKFAENIEGARKFLVDYIGSSRPAFQESGFQNMPSFPNAVPDLADLVANDASGSTRYAVLANLPALATNLGHPGFANAAIDEVYRTGLIPTMFARAATGQLTPEEALDQADKQVQDIFRKWRQAGKI